MRVVTAGRHGFTDASLYSNLEEKMNILKESRVISNSFIIATLLSITLSIAIWVGAVGDSAEQTQRLALFVGLWAPTFMGFANYYKEE